MMRMPTEVQNEKIKRKMNFDETILHHLLLLFRCIKWEAIFLCYMIDGNQQTLLRKVEERIKI